jgi:hypothetical protein
MTTVSAHGDTSTVTEETAEPTPDTNKLRTAITELIGGDLASVNTMLNKQLGSPHPYMADSATPDSSAANRFAPSCYSCPQKHWARTLAKQATPWQRLLK